MMHQTFVFHSLTNRKVPLYDYLFKKINVLFGNGMHLSDLSASFISEVACAYSLDLRLQC